MEYFGWFDLRALDAAVFCYPLNIPLSRLASGNVVDIVPEASLVSEGSELIVGSPHKFGIDSADVGLEGLE